MAKKKLTSVLVKPTGADCNIDCTYCFYLDRAGTLRPGFQDNKGFDRLHGRKMSDEVQEEMIRQIMKAGSGQVSFGWQGGEPTMMGVPFFERAVRMQKKHGATGQTVGNGLQTNGLLINEEWCDFLRDTNWLVGLSIDGPDHVHNHYRVDRYGKGTYDRVRAAGELMAKKNVQFNALTVVNNHSVQHAKEIYNHHKDLGTMHMQFIPCVERDPYDPTKATQFTVGAEAYGKFLCDIFDCWKEDFKNGRPTVSVRYFDSVFHTYVGLCAPECTLLKECGCYVVIEHNGDVYSCDFFVEGDWKLGNLMNGSMEEMLNSSKQKDFGLLKSDMPKECYSCKYLKHCYGGCTKDRLRDPADNGSNHFCKSFIQFFDHADEDLKQLAEDWKKERRRIQGQAAVDMNTIRSQTRPGQNRGAPPASRNAPCPCGSGMKFKHCCEKRMKARTGK